jgi:hypothetical protein
MKTLVPALLALLVLSSCKSCKHSTTEKPIVDQPVTQPPKPGVRNDLRIVLHEEMLNKVFKALGPISGTEEYKILFSTNHYTWTVLNPQIRLKPGKADFVADVNVKTGPFDYNSNIVGDVAVTYDAKKNLINVKITHAVFEIYTKVLGTKYHLKDLDLAQYFPDPFSFEGPAGMETDMDFTMPDNSVRKVWMKPTDCDVIVEDHQISVPCETEFYQKPAKTTPK